MATEPRDYWVVCPDFQFGPFTARMAKHRKDVVDQATFAGRCESPHAVVRQRSKGSALRPGFPWRPR